MKILQKIKEKHVTVSAVLTAVICAAVIFITLTFPEPVGLGNSGDYSRIITPNKITYIGEAYGKDRYYPDFEMLLEGETTGEKFLFLFSPDYSQYDYYTSQSVLVQISKALNFTANLATGRALSDYNLFWLGLTYLVFFAFAIYFITRFIYKRLGLGLFLFASAVFLIVFSDHGYVLYFNSFFGEAMQYVFTFMAIGLFLRLWDRYMDEKDGVFTYLLYDAAVVLMATAKNAYFPVGILFMLLPLIFVFQKGMRRRKKGFIGAASAVVMAVLIFAGTLTPQWIDKDTTFNAVFAGILKFSDTPERDLIELGLNPSFAVLQGEQTYRDEYPIDISSERFEKEFYDKVSKMTILKFYITHPDRWLESLLYTGMSENTGYLRAPYLGNYTNPTEPGEQEYRYSMWETFRMWSHIHALWVTILVCAALFAICIRYLFRKRDRCVPFALLLAVFLASAVFNFVIPYMSNGVCDLAKHLFGFIQFYDIMLMTLVGYLLWWGKAFVMGPPAGASRISPGAAA